MKKKATKAKKSTEKKAATSKAATKKVAAKKSATKKATTKKVSAKKATATKAVSKKAVTKKAASKKVVAKKAAPKKAAAKKVAAKKAAPKKVASKKVVAKKAAPKKVAPKKVAAKKAASKKVVAKKAAPKKAAAKKAAPKMKLDPNEKWKKLTVDGISNASHYKISNKGNVMSIAEDPNGKLIKGSRIGGYKTLCVRLESGKRSTRYVHKLVAQTFLKKKKADQNRDYVIHVNHDKLNNAVDNLKWANKEEVTEHQKENPVQQTYHKGLVTNSKLTESKVKVIKKMLKRKNVRKKVVASQFGITVTQLNRIANGENWAHVKV